MDGVPMVTQCPILPFGGFRYKLKPENVGTYIYYAHIGKHIIFKTMKYVNWLYINANKNIK